MQTCIDEVIMKRQETQELFHNAVKHVTLIQLLHSMITEADYWWPCAF